MIKIFIFILLLSGQKFFFSIACSCTISHLYIIYMYHVPGVVVAKVVVGSLDVVVPSTVVVTSVVLVSSVVASVVVVRTVLVVCSIVEEISVAQVNKHYLALLLACVKM